MPKELMPIICGLCREPMDFWSRTLPCKHSFCGSCLEKKYFNSTTQITIGSCTTCDQTFEIPVSINSIPKNQFLERLMELKLKSCRKECDNCGRKEVESFCKTCKLFFCCHCTEQTHTKHKASNSHDILELNRRVYLDEVKREKFKFCTVHDKIINIYCEFSEKYVCQDCCKIFDKWHRHVGIKEKMFEKRSEIESNIAELNCELDYFKENLKKFDSEYSDDRKNLIFHVEKRREQLKAEVDAAAYRLTDQINKYFDGQNKCYDDYKKISIRKKNEIEMNLNALQTTLNQLNFKTLTDDFAFSTANKAPIVPKWTPCRKLITELNLCEAHPIDWTFHIGSWDVQQTKIVLTAKE